MILPVHQARIAAPFGVLGIQMRDGRLAGIDFLSARAVLITPQNELAAEVCRQLRAYLRDGQFRFDLPLELWGTDFRQRVWAAMRRIPAGQTRSYGDLARELHSAPRAVGQACGDNPIPIVIPCHRVVGSSGLGGFMHQDGGRPLNIKQWLLDHERP